MKLKFVCVNGNKERLLKAFRFRYQIFCIEKKFYDKNNYKNKIETDIYDKYSLHFAAFDEDENIVGYVRVVCNSKEGYPIEKLCPYPVTLNQKDSRKNIAEISRLAIDKRYRVHTNREGINEFQQSNLMPLSVIKKFCASRIQMGLYRFVYYACTELNITHLYAVMEKTLFDCLLQTSIEFKILGTEFDNHGMVAPYIGKVSASRQSLFSDRQLLFFTAENILKSPIINRVFFIAS